jgi:hypothetical protein
MSVTFRDHPEKQREVFCENHGLQPSPHKIIAFFVLSLVFSVRHLGWMNSSDTYILLPTSLLFPYWELAWDVLPRGMIKRDLPTTSFYSRCPLLPRPLFSVIKV